MMEATCQEQATRSIRLDGIVELVTEIDEYGNLPVNWDTYGGQPACEKARLFARELIFDLYQLRDIPLPAVAPISTGVMLTWKSEGRDTYIEVDDESALFRHEGRMLKRTYGEDPTYNVDDAINLLKALHSQGML